MRPTKCLQAATTSLGGPTSGVIYASQLPTWIGSQTMKQQGLLLKRASPARPFLTSAPAPPSLSQPPPAPASRSSPQPRASPLQSRISPRPTALRQNSGGPWPRARFSYHRGRWLCRKAEVRKWPAPRRLPFREKLSLSLRPDFRTVPSMIRAEKGEPRNTWSFGNFPARTVLTFLDS